MAVVPAGFDEQYAVAAGFGEAIGEDAAGRAGADDDVIEPRFVPDRRHGRVPPFSLPELVSINFFLPRESGEGGIGGCAAVL